MFINAAWPQVPHTWNDGNSLRGGTLLSNNNRSLGVAASEAQQSHLRPQKQSSRQRPEAQQPFLSTLTPAAKQDIKAWSRKVSHHPHRVPDYTPQQYHQQKLKHRHQKLLFQQRQRKMDSGRLCYVMGDGQESYLTEDMYGNEDFSGMPGLGAPNDIGHQTSGGYHVSGRGADPSHNQPAHQRQLNKGSGQYDGPQPMGWPSFQTANTNMYSPPPFSFDNDYPSQYSMPPMFGDPSSVNYMGLQHGLPSNGWAPDSDMPMLDGGLANSTGVSPTGTAYSSFSSSASDAMASMSLDNSMASQGGSSDHLNVGCPSTVSPKLLRINPSPAPTAASESPHASFTAGDGGDYPNVSSSYDQYYVPSIPTSVPSSALTSTKRLNAKGRKELPDKPRTSYTSADHGSSHHHSSRDKGSQRQSRHRYQSEEQQQATEQEEVEEQAVASPRRTRGLKPKPSPATTSSSLSCSSSSTSHHHSQAGLTPQEIERNKKDQFLVDSKLAGMSYKEIRRKGGFTEAESTLRGRFRTLTKPKDARVRKPEWTEIDDRLLKKSVRKLAKTDDPDKVPWKQVSEYITNNGGTYQFGNSTCRRRWDKLVDEGEASF